MEPASEPLSTADVMDKILLDIQTGALAPGAWLKQIDLERRYRCGRPEVRLALDRLAQKHVIEHIPNRGYHVYRPDAEQVRQIGEIRLLLETGVTDAILAHATAADVAALTRFADRFDALTLHGTLFEMYEANLAFHRALLALCGNDELVGLIADIRQRTSIALVSQWLTQARIRQSSQEHYEMIAAIAAGDGGQLKAVITRHIKQSAI